MLLLSFLIYGALLSVNAKLTVPRSANPPSTGFPAEVIFQSPVPFENIAVRASSELLLTSFASPTLFAFDPKTINGTLVPVHTFPNATALTGIAEYSPGQFALVAADINITTFRALPGSIVLWTIDLNAQTPAVRVLTALPTSEGANGVTALPGHPDILLVADSYMGGIWQIDLRTGSAHLAIQDASMLPEAPSPAVGINGLHIRDASQPYLYFTNSQKGTLGRVAFRVDGGKITAARAVETLATIQSAAVAQNPDDFAIDCEGRAWVTVHPGALTMVAPPADGNGSWTQETVLGNVEGSDADLGQPTSAAFGCGSTEQEKTLYVVTGVGQIVSVDTSG